MWNIVSYWPLAGKTAASVLEHALIQSSFSVNALPEGSVKCIKANVKHGPDLFLWDVLTHVHHKVLVTLDELDYTADGSYELF